MKSIIFLFAVFVSLSFISSCSGLKDIENYKGENISMAVGDIASVKMEADTYSGYDWVVASNSNSAVAKYEGKDTKFGEKNTDLSTQIIKFKGLKKGKTIVTLNYIKQGDMIAKKTRTVNITVY
ncbi:MAG TPA: protease inhibitor I42 family protein [Ignavibacteria bacterium]|nr:protease inhibitor I42 family protein [Ignavibacteria bacterium]